MLTDIEKVLYLISKRALDQYLKSFTLEITDRSNQNGRTVIERQQIGQRVIPYYMNEYWTARQRQASSLHEVSYRACFKPQLPRFFISLLTKPGQIVYDPFSGRGTTALEAALLGRRVIANDINPLSKILCLPRLTPPDLSLLAERLKCLPLDGKVDSRLDLSMFYHPRTERELLSLRQYLKERRDSGQEDQLDYWIRMVATNRLTGHSKGFFSVYTMPPNQAVSAERQILINRKRKQNPDYRDVQKLILRKSSQLIARVTSKELANLLNAAASALFLEADAAATEAIAAESVDLTVTSPPFLNVVQYADDNWLRLWFNSINRNELDSKLTVKANLKAWLTDMQQVLNELFRITRPGGWVAFEVGEVRNGRLKLECEIIPHAYEAGFDCYAVLINDQEFTKTANIWGVTNNKAGTNSNRIILLKKIQGRALY